jgi:cytochrome P450
VTVPDISPGFDFTDPEIYRTRVPAEELAELRRAAPVWWVAQRRGSAGFDDEGYWAVTRHGDILAVSKNPEVYSSSENTALIRFAGAFPASPSTCSESSCSTWIRLSTLSCAASSPAALPRAIGNLR